MRSIVASEIVGNVAKKREEWGTILALMRVFFPSYNLTIHGFYRPSNATVNDAIARTSHPQSPQSFSPSSAHPLQASVLQHTPQTSSPSSSTRPSMLPE